MTKNTEYIQTYTGIMFSPFNPLADDVNIEDIAHHLSNICRYLVAVSQFYSVAQHSVYVSRYCHPDHALRGLLHDATEAYLTDLPAPLKHNPKFAFYRKMEQKLDNVICDAFWLDHSMHESIKIADRRVFQTERRYLMQNYPPGFMPGVAEEAIHNLVIRPLSPERAETAFITRYGELTKRRYFNAKLST